MTGIGSRVRQTLLLVPIEAHQSLHWFKLFSSSAVLGATPASGGDSLGSLPAAPARCRATLLRTALICCCWRQAARGPLNGSGSKEYRGRKLILSVAAMPAANEADSDCLARPRGHRFALSEAL